MLERMRVMAGWLAALAALTALAVGWIGAWAPEAEGQTWVPVPIVLGTGIPANQAYGYENNAWTSLLSSSYTAGWFLAAPCGSPGFALYRPVCVADLPGSAVRNQALTITDPVVSGDNGSMVNIAAAAGWVEQLPAIGTTGFAPNAFNTTLWTAQGSGGGQLSVTGGATINGTAGPLTFAPGTGFWVWSDATAAPGNYVAAQFGMPLVGSVSTASGTINVGQCNTGTVGVTGATTSMVVEVSPSAGTPGPQYYWRGYVSSTNTVKVDICSTTAAQSPGAVAFNIRVLQ